MDHVTRETTMASVEAWPGIRLSPAMPSIHWSVKPSGGARSPVPCDATPMDVPSESRNSSYLAS